MGRISVRQENMLVFCAYMYVCMYMRMPVHQPMVKVNELLSRF